MPSTQSTNSGAGDSRGVDTNSLQADASAAMDKVQDTAKAVADEASAQASGLAGKAKAQLSDAADSARKVADEQRQFVAAQIGGVADAMEKAADELERNNGASGQYARMIADSAEQLSSTLRDKSVDDLLAMAQDFGRKQPLAFVGAAALLGFAASRFVMAAASPAPTASTNSGGMTPVTNGGPVSAPRQERMN